MSCAGSAVHGHAASATARARYLAPLARCALLQTAMVEHCTRSTARQNRQSSSCLQQDVADVYSSPVDTMNRNQTATNRDIMMRFKARHYSAYMQPLFVQSERPLSVFTRNRSARGWCGKSRCAPYMHVGTALAVRCNARAANATDLRARYLAPLARCALLPTLPRRRCTPPSRRIRSSAAAVSFL